jgi:hypothetical protein
LKSSLILDSPNTAQLSLAHVGNPGNGSFPNGRMDLLQMPHARFLLVWSGFPIAGMALIFSAIFSAVGILKRISSMLPSVMQFNSRGLSWPSFGVAGSSSLVTWGVHVGSDSHLDRIRSSCRWVVHAFGCGLRSEKGTFSVALLS